MASDDEYACVKAARTLIEAERLDLQALQIAVNAEFVGRLEDKGHAKRNDDIGDDDLAAGVARLMAHADAKARVVAIGDEVGEGVALPVACDGESRPLAEGAA